MKKVHDEGDIDYIIQNNNFTGSYAEMVDGVNKLTHSQITLTKKIVEVVGSYSKGDFDYVMEKLPGKKVFINDALEALRRNMMVVNEEILKIIEATSQGNLNVRGNETRFDYAFYSNMVKGINNMLESVVVPINETMNVMKEVAAGKIAASMNLRVKKKIKNS